MWTISALMTFVSMTTTIEGHGRLLEPPNRSTASHLAGITPQNNMDHQLNCGGFGNQWSINQGRCGVCGDPYQGPRENEAGGKYANGIIARHYTESQTINVVIEMTVPHGGWSEFRICPNNDVHKAVTQQCLDRYLLATPSGETRITHQHVTGKFTIKIVLPPGLTCTQCVLQWKWNGDSNNNCNSVTHENCCNGCGPQEQFYGCADVSIERATPVGIPDFTVQLIKPVTYTPTKPVTYTPIKPVTYTPPPNANAVDGYNKIDVDVINFIPPQSTLSTCRATDMGRNIYGINEADQMCQKLCVPSSHCPIIWCDSSCRNMKRIITIV